MAASSHSAAPSALGYLYQSQWPLLELLRGAEQRPDCAITIELHDDVAWDNDGNATELLQLKHHVRSMRSLGDKDADIWRTIRVWMETENVGDPTGPKMTMVTTQTAAPSTAAAALRPEEMGRDLAEAVRLLTVAAEESTSQASAPTRAKFLQLPQGVREVFVGRMYVLDHAPTIDDLDGEVRRVLHWTLPRGHEDTFMELLWSWWHGKVIGMLQGRRHSVSGVDAKAVVDDIRDRFTRDNLPTLVSPNELNPTDHATYLDRRFVQQLHWVDTPPQLIQKAIIDYYRAYTQTVRWVDDDLIGLDELESFEERLRDEWEREFAWMANDLPPDADEDAKRRAGLRLLRETLDRTGIRIRVRYDEAFFLRGKHHELADDGRVGWHLDFRQRLEDLLSTVTS